MRDPQSDKLLEVKNLQTYFDAKSKKKGWLSSQQHLKAVDGVSFDIHKGEVLALVGESGCGKTTVGRSILQLVTAAPGYPKGEVSFDGTRVFEQGRQQWKELKSNMQIVFQDPYSSLNPRMTVGQLIKEGLDIQNIGNESEREEKVKAIMEKVGLNPDYRQRFPHEFSGGQRQRICIARALVLSPKFVVCDEAVSALDVSVQAQVLNLLNKLKNEMDLSYLFIAHNLSVVEHIADRIAVMYLGKIVEIGTREQIFNRPQHPYTQALLSAIPRITSRGSKTSQRIILQGDLPSPTDPPSGCHFHERCPKMEARCAQEAPNLENIEQQHQCACWLPGPIQEKSSH